MVTRVDAARYAGGMTRPLTVPDVASLHRVMVLAILMLAVPTVTLERLVDPVTAQPHWLDVAGTVLVWPLQVGVVWWVWRAMRPMKLTPRMPLAWQAMGAAMFTLIRVVVVSGVMSAALGVLGVAVALHARERVPEELVTLGFGVLVALGATFLLSGSATRGVRG